MRHAKSIADRERPRHRVGKQPMFRSAKKSVKKKEAPKEIDPEKLAFLQYLGDLEEDANAAA